MYCVTNDVLEMPFESSPLNQKKKKIEPHTREQNTVMLLHDRAGMHSDAV